MSYHDDCKYNCGATDCASPVKPFDMSQIERPDFSKQARSLRKSIQSRMVKLREAITGVKK